MPDMVKERIVVVEEGADLLRDAVVREPAAPFEFAGLAQRMFWFREALEREARILVGFSRFPPGEK